MEIPKDLRLKVKNVKAINYQIPEPGLDRPLLGDVLTLQAFEINFNVKMQAFIKFYILPLTGT